MQTWPDSLPPPSDDGPPWFALVALGLAIVYALACLPGGAP